MKDPKEMTNDELWTEVMRQTRELEQLNLDVREEIRSGRRWAESDDLSFDEIVKEAAEDEAERVELYAVEEGDSCAKVTRVWTDEEIVELEEQRQRDKAMEEMWKEANR